MNSCICVCCGEAMGPHAQAFSRNPNVCASCSSMADGMDDLSLPLEPSESPSVSESPTLDTAPSGSLNASARNALTRKTLTPH